MVGLATHGIGKGVSTVWRLTASFVIAAAVMVFSDLAFAQAAGGLGTVATNISGTFNAIGQVLLGGMFLGGLGVGGSGLMKLKQAAETQGQQVKYSDGMWRVAVGAGLIAVPAVLTTLNTTFFGSPNAGTAQVGTAIPVTAR